MTTTDTGVRYNQAKQAMFRLRINRDQVELELSDQAAEEGSMRVDAEAGLTIEPITLGQVAALEGLIGQARRRASVKLGDALRRTPAGAEA